MSPPNPASIPAALCQSLSDESQPRPWPNLRLKKPDSSFRCRSQLCNNTENLTSKILTIPKCLTQPVSAEHKSGDANSMLCYLRLRGRCSLELQMSGQDILQHCTAPSLGFTDLQQKQYFPAAVDVMQLDWLVVLLQCPADCDSESVRGSSHSRLNIS